MPPSPRQPKRNVSEAADLIGAADTVVLLEDENTRDGSFVAAVRRLGVGPRHPEEER
jgi:hypothetical protein